MALYLNYAPFLEHSSGEVYLIKKEGPTSRQVTAKQSAAVGLKPGNVETSTITIREMLTGVNDYYGQPFINEDGTGNYVGALGISYKDKNKFNEEMNGQTKGSTSPMSDGSRLIQLFETADESTFLHEMGHLFLLDLEDLPELCTIFGA